MSSVKSISMIPVELLLSDPEHVRLYGPTTKEADPHLSSLSLNIRETGLVQPLTVSRGTPGIPDNTVAFGMRRLVAAKLAGITEVPVILHAFSSADAMRQAMILNNQSRVKTPWQILMERILLKETYRREAKKRQQRAGGPKRCATTATQASNAQEAEEQSVNTTSAEASESAPAAENVDVVPHLHNGNDSTGDTDVASRVTTSACAGSPRETPAPTQGGLLNEPAGESAPISSEPKESSSAETPETPGEAYKKAARMLGLSENTLRLSSRLYEHARTLNPADPSASEVAVKLLEPGARIETVAREFGLTRESSPTRGGGTVTADPCDDPTVAARALRRHAEALIPDGAVSGPRPSLDPTLTIELLKAVEAVVALLATTATPSLRLVHECPRLGPSRPPLRPEQIIVNEKTLREAICDALADKMSSSDIARWAGIKSAKARQAFVAWCNDKSVPLRREDQLRLVQWVETHHGSPNLPKESPRLIDDVSNHEEVA